MFFLKFAATATTPGYNYLIDNYIRRGSKL